MITLYHGTTSKRASKVVGNAKHKQEGFFVRNYDCVFLAEELETAKFFGSEKTYDAVATAIDTGNPDAPVAYTVLEITLSDALAAELGIDEARRSPLGLHTGMAFPDIPGGSGFERILIGNEAIEKFNESLREGAITIRRLKFSVRPRGAFA